MKNDDFTCEGEMWFFQDKSILSSCKMAAYFFNGAEHVYYTSLNVLKKK